MDVRLYKRAKSIADPFAFEEYKKRKIREKIEQERPSRIKVEDNLPKVNRDLASRLLDNESNKKKQSSNLLKDDRFKVICFFLYIRYTYMYVNVITKIVCFLFYKALFENPDFEVDREADEYRLLNPVLARFDKNKGKSKLEEETMEVCKCIFLIYTPQTKTYTLSRYIL